MTRTGDQPNPPVPSLPGRGQHPTSARPLDRTRRDEVRALCRSPFSGSSATERAARPSTATSRSWPARATRASPSSGRLTLGLGLSHRAVTERVWGVPWDRPIRRMSEYLDGLLPLLDGRKADAAGETVTTRGSLRIAAPRPDVYIAALGPQMLRLAGRRTRGTVTWMTGPRTLAEHVGPTLRDAAEEAGRPREAVRVVASLPVSVTDQVDRARVGLPFGDTPEDHARTRALL